MTQISQRVEAIFAHAVAMDQSGKLRNTIYAAGNTIYILNSDNTVLLRFRLRKSETPFAHPVSFKANDYDSRSFREENGRIIFVIENGDYKREKSCKTPGMTPEDVAELYSKYEDKENETLLDRGVLTLLNDSLSHIEFSAEGKELSIVQRDIYSGSVIEITRSIKKRGFGLDMGEGVTSDFLPIGLRTNDLSAMFTFQDSIYFGFPSPGQPGNYVTVRGADPKMDMSGIIACCVYDELGTVEGVQIDKPVTTEEKPARRRRT